MKTKTSITDILALLPLLDKKDLTAVQARVAHLLAYVGADTQNADAGIAQDLYLALKSALDARRIACAPWPVFRKSSLYTSFAERVAQLAPFLEQLPSLTRVEQAALYGTFIRLLAAALDRQQIPITARTLCTNMHRLPEATENAFPGYLEAGMLPWILNAAQSGS